MKILLATDHAGFELKEQLKVLLLEQRYLVEDMGAYELIPDDDYPVYMHHCAQLLQQNPDSRAIVFGGSGTGEAIVMNRYSGVRTVVYNGQDLEIVHLGRAHNDANALSIGARFASLAQVQDAVLLFVNTLFEQGRHSSRVAQIDDN